MGSDSALLVVGAITCRAAENNKDCDEHEMVLYGTHILSLCGALIRSSTISGYIVEYLHMGTVGCGHDLYRLATHEEADNAEKIPGF